MTSRLALGGGKAAFVVGETAVYWPRLLSSLSRACCFGADAEARVLRPSGGPSPAPGASLMCICTYTFFFLLLMR